MDLYKESKKFVGKIKSEYPEIAICIWNLLGIRNKYQELKKLYPNIFSTKVINGKKFYINYEPDLNCDYLTIETYLKLPQCDIYSDEENFKFLSNFIEKNNTSDYSRDWLSLEKEGDKFKLKKALSCANDYSNTGYKIYFDFSVLNYIDSVSKFEFLSKLINIKLSKCGIDSIKNFAIKAIRIQNLIDKYLCDLDRDNIFNKVKL